MWCLAAGLVVGVFLSHAWWPWCALMAMLAMANLVPPRAARIVPLVPLFAAGFMYGAWHIDRAVEKRLPDALADQIETVAGTVVDLPTEELWSAREGAPLFRTAFVLDLTEGVPAWPGARNLRLVRFGERPLQLLPGDQLALQVRLRPVRGAVNQAGFDSERLLLARGMDGAGTVQSVLRHRRGAGWSLDRLRARLAGGTAHGIEGVAAAILPALVAGDRRGLESDHWRVLQRTGSAHLIAISGLHISLVAGLVWGVSRRLSALFFLCRQSPAAADRWAVPPALLAAGAYAALAGFSLPTCRALLMLGVVMLALCFGRRIRIVVVLQLALAVLLVMDPLAALEGGFWLSFLAVAVLAATLGRGWRDLLRVQVAVSLTTGAAAAWLFGSWSLVAIPANLVLVPLYSILVVPLALAGAVLPGGQEFLHAAAWLINLGWEGMLRAAELPILPAVDGPLIAIALMLPVLRWGVPGLCMPRWSLLLVVLPWLWPVADAPAPGHFDLVMFDVGQGQMSVIRTRHRVLVYDTGPRWHDGSPVASVLEPWLARHRLEPDLVFVSHGDDDHAGGVEDFRRRWPAVPMFSGEPGRLGAWPCHAGQRWQLDGVDVQVLWPTGLSLERSNNHSCVLRIRGSGGSVLLTGDIEKPVEFALLEEDLKSDVLQVPHHGSRTSSSFAFVRAVQPELAVVGAGYLNRFDHPAADIRQRYRTLDIPFYDTASTGMQQVRMDGREHVVPQLWREHSRWPWRFPVPVVE